MSDQVELNVASVESVALELTLDISQRESLYNDPAYREKLLNLYTECLEATRGRRKISE